MSNPIIIVDYDPQWPEMFMELRARIATVLGDLAAAIEHVGSTAVPGLAAKPVIDIDVLLSSSDGLPQAIERLASLGYAHRGDLGVAGRDAFRQPFGQPAHHLYVCPPDSIEYRRHIEFRDHLRAYPESARRYVELKRNLAAEFGNDRERYNTGKTEFVDKIVRSAFRPRLK